MVKFYSLRPAKTLSLFISTALMTTIPISAVGQEENLSPVPRSDENGFLMIPEDRST